jgi:hypothetical protein
MKVLKQQRLERLAAKISEDSLTAAAQKTQPGKDRPRPRPRPRPRRREQKPDDGDVQDINIRRDNDDDNDDEVGDEDEEGREQRDELRGPSLMDKFEFCRVHVSEEKIVPLGIERDYPLHIDFTRLPERVKRMEAQLRGIIEKTVPSVYLDLALDNYQRMGTLGARNPHVILANVATTLVSNLVLHTQGTVSFRVTIF